MQVGDFKKVISVNLSN